MSNDLILEVEESLKQERLQELWNEYGGYLIAACVMAVLFTALIVGWRGWNEKIATAQTAQIVQAITMEDPAEAAPVLEELSAQLTDGRKAIALLSAAGWYLDNEQQAEALAIYQKMQADSELPQTYRDFAALLEARALWGAEETSIDASALLDKLAALRNNTKSPWHYHALVQSAVIAANGQQKYDTAIEYLAVVNKAYDIPNSLRSRAEALAHIYSLSAEKQAATEDKVNSDTGS